MQVWTCADVRAWNAASTTGLSSQIRSRAGRETTATAPDGSAPPPAPPLAGADVPWTPAAAAPAGCSCGGKGCPECTGDGGHSSCGGISPAPVAGEADDGSASGSSAGPAPSSDRLGRSAVASVPIDSAPLGSAAAASAMPQQPWSDGSCCCATPALATGNASSSEEEGEESCSCWPPAVARAPGGDLGDEPARPPPLPAVFSLSSPKGGLCRAKAPALAGGSGAGCACAASPASRPNDGSSSPPTTACWSAGKHLPAAAKQRRAPCFRSQDPPQHEPPIAIYKRRGRAPDTSWLGGGGSRLQLLVGGCEDASGQRSSSPLP